MSKIKDLWAIENGVEDLMPLEAIPPSEDKVLEQCTNLMTSNKEKNEDTMLALATLEVDDNEDGQTSVIISDFDDLMYTIAENTLDEYICDQHLDLSDEVYYSVRDKLAEKAGEIMDKFAKEIIDECGESEIAARDYERERRGEC